MALTTDEISALTEKLWVPIIADNTFNSNPLMARLWQRGPKEAGGTAIRAPLMFARVGSAGAIRGFDTMVIDADDQFTAADWDWKEYYAAIVLSRREMLQNTGEPEQLSHLSAKAQASEMTLRDLLGTGLYSDGTANTKLIDGLDAVTGLTNTYPNSGGGSIGIDRAAETWWAAGFRGTGGTAVGVQLGVANALTFLQKASGRVTQQPNSPTMFVTTQANFDQIFNSYGPLQRFEDDHLASLGFETILFRRVPIVVDSHTTVTGVGGLGALYVLNENFLQLYTHREENFRFDPFREPINQKVMVGKIYWTGNLICTNPRFQGVCTDPAAA